MNSSDTAPGRGTAVVIGGGLAGVVAAWALRGFAERIVVVERDRYPDEPVFRAGVPQGRHAHLVLEAGHRALEELMPGINRELTAAGAHRVSASGDLKWLSSAGWMVDYPARMSFLSCTRPVLDKLVLDRVRTEPSIEFLEGTDVVGLLGSAQAVTGVKLRERGSEGGEVLDLPAELVIDAAGRSTSVPKWLAELGCRPVPEERVDPGVAYASRLFHRPPGVDFGHQAIYLQTKAPDKPRMGVLLPVEGDRWIVSLAGMRGAEPEPGEEGFTKHLSQLRDPGLSEMLRNAEPAGEVRGFLPGPGVRRHYERGAPAGLVAVGDAASTFNPVYGQGVTVSLFCAQVLRRTATRHSGIGPATARDARREIAAVSKNAWMMSCAEDVRFAATTGGPSGALIKLQHRYLDKVLHGATRNAEVTAAFHEVLSLVAPPTRLFHPSVVAAVLRA
ncbi:MULTISPECIES: NAD(P)/FAD-dependent oxidoreductase [Kitasatospora]|uniref:FAD-dependent monooxygenase n=1 Tax=Kitasatospora cathayae TaxID=3004092 RepID=A0ABY7QE01_9ACTN|nr:FAD-dependent oxidoreductase [Kitasatospora sp. HUAS 3-15]WBP90920.1 FAD-dependent monooxygenase [Kitasatospora sp. HUAS 3-15]